jgi:hypothetical protein
MKPEQLDWHSGTVVFWDLDFLDPLKPLINQIDDLKEDLAQIRYPGAVLVDIGWFPEFSSEGSFVVSVVREPHWDEPLFREEHRTVDELLRRLPEAVRIANAAG